MEAYQPDRTLKGKLRRRLVRLSHRRPASRAPVGPMLSFSFDDAPLTAATDGARILEERDVRGTYFLSAGLAGQPSPMGDILGADAARRLSGAGHEIACHTFTHLDCGQASGPEAAENAARNLDVLEGWGLSRPVTFAYPYGDVSAPAKQALAARYGLLRALHHGVIERGSDLNQAPAVGIEGDDGEAVALRWLETAATRNAWLILYTHDVAERPSQWGCTPGALARLADAALARGFKLCTVAEGLAAVA